MPTRAPRLPGRPQRGSARGAWRMLCLWLAFLVPVAGAAQEITGARYADPTDRYAHGVLGDAIEWGALELTLADGRTQRFALPLDLVFEDTAPRLHDLDGDTTSEVIVVEASLTKGARLAVYDAKGRITATPFIGRPHRWLAPIGAGDLYGDGHQIIAYIDRPHLAKTLRLWRFHNRSLHPVESLKGLSNHRIGDDYITGGIRDCGQGPQIITPDANWRHIMITVTTDGGLVTRPAAPYTGPASVNDVLNCR